MPEMDGYKASGQIRKHKGAGHNPPIIALTAAARVGDSPRVARGGTATFWQTSKPTAIAAVLARWVGETGGRIQY